MLPHITFLPDNMDLLSSGESVAQSAGINTQDLAFPFTCESVETLHFSKTVLKKTMALHLSCFQTCVLPDQDKRSAFCKRCLFKKKKKRKKLWFPFSLYVKSVFLLPFLPSTLFSSNFYFYFFSTQNLYCKTSSLLLHKLKHTTFIRHLPVLCLSWHAKEVKIKQILTAASVFTRKSVQK